MPQLSHTCSAPGRSVDESLFSFCQPTGRQRRPPWPLAAAAWPRPPHLAAGMPCAVGLAGLSLQFVLAVPGHSTRSVRKSCFLHRTHTPCPERQQLLSFLAFVCLCGSRKGLGPCDHKAAQELSHLLPCCVPGLAVPRVNARVLLKQLLTTARGCLRAWHSLQPASAVLQDPEFFKMPWPQNHLLPVELA